MKKIWAPEEDEIVRQNWLTEGFVRDFAHLLPNRSVLSIEKRGFNLGLGPRKVWTQEQDDYLRKIWVGQDRIKSHAHMFPAHTLQSIYTRAHLLGLGTRPHRGGFDDAYGWCVIRNVLERGPAICSDLVEDTKLHPSVVFKYLKQRHKKGEIHIVSWARKTPSGKPVPVYAYGTGQDAEKPARLSPAEKEKKRRHSLQHKRLLAGETVKSINVFATAAGLVKAPISRKGRVIKQDMTIHLHDELEAA